MSFKKECDGVQKVNAPTITHISLEALKDTLVDDDQNAWNVTSKLKDVWSLLFSVTPISGIVDIITNYFDISFENFRVFKMENKGIVYKDIHQHAKQTSNCICQFCSIYNSMQCLLKFFCSDDNIRAQAFCISDGMTGVMYVHDVPSEICDVGQKIHLKAVSSYEGFLSRTKDYCFVDAIWKFKTVSTPP